MCHKVHRTCQNFTSPASKDCSQQKTYPGCSNDSASIYSGTIKGMNASHCNIKNTDTVNSMSRDVQNVIKQSVENKGNEKSFDELVKELNAEGINAKIGEDGEGKQNLIVEDSTGTGVIWDRDGNGKIDAGDFTKEFSNSSNNSSCSGNSDCNKNFNNALTDLINSLNNANSSCGSGGCSGTSGTSNTCNKDSDDSKDSLLNMIKAMLKAENPNASDADISSKAKQIESEFKMIKAFMQTQQGNQGNNSNTCGCKSDDSKSGGFNAKDMMLLMGLIQANKPDASTGASTSTSSTTSTGNITIINNFIAA